MGSPDLLRWGRGAGPRACSAITPLYVAVPRECAGRRRLPGYELLGGASGHVRAHCASSRRAERGRGSHDDRSRGRPPRPSRTPAWQHRVPDSWRFRPWQGCSGRGPWPAAGDISSSLAAARSRTAIFPLFSAGATILNHAATTLPPIMLAAFYTPQVTGLFGLAQRMISLPMVLVGAAVSQVFTW